MARSPRLNAAPAFRFAALVAVVLLAHALLLRWVALALDAQSILKPMATPMFTRLLQQEAPAAVPDAPPPPVAGPARAAITSVKKTVKPARKPASSPAQPDEPPQRELASAPPAPESAAPAAEPAPSVADTVPTPLATASSPSPAASAAVAAVSAPASAPVANLDSWPADTRLSYTLSGWFRGDLYGSARVQWQRQQENYQVRIEIDITPFANVFMTSQGQVTAQGLSPRAYEEQRRSGPRGVRMEGDTLVLSDGRRLPRPDRVQDTASQFVELSHRFATGEEKLEVGRSIQLWLARPGGADLWTYDIVGREVLVSRTFGALETYHLQPRPVANGRGNIYAEMWFAPSLQLLPVRIKVNMGSDTWVDLMVDRIEQR